MSLEILKEASMLLGRCRRMIDAYVSDSVPSKPFLLSDLNEFDQGLGNIFKKGDKHV